MDYFLYFFAGSLAGFVLSLLGIGGGMLLVICLLYFLEPSVTDPYELVRYLIANASLVMLGTLLVGTLRDWKNDSFGRKRLLAITLPAIGTGLLTTWLLLRFDWLGYLPYFIALEILLVFSVYQLLTHTDISFKTDCHSGGKADTFRDAFAGLLSGIVLALTGTESSAVTVPFINRYCQFKIERAIRINMLAILLGLACTLPLFLFTPPKGLVEFQWTQGYIIWDMSLPILTGALTTSLLGTKAAQKVHFKIATYGLSFFLIIIGLRILFVNLIYRNWLF